MNAPPHPLGIAGRLAATFLDSKLTPLAILTSLLLGLFAILSLPREEEPQIKVPMIDVITALPGADPAEVESRVTRPLEQWLWEVPDAEYLYATSSSGQSLLVVRFKVGTDMEQALIRVQQRLEAHRQELPPGAIPLVQPRGIDDVPILALTFHSEVVSPLDLRRVAAQAAEALRAVPGVAETQLIGGARRELRIELLPAALTAHGLTPADISRSLTTTQQRLPLGAHTQAGAAVVLEAGQLFSDAASLAAWPVSSPEGRTVPLGEVARILDTEAEPVDYVRHRGAGPEAIWENAVTLTFAKRPGVNAITVVNAVQARLASLQGTLIPSEIEITLSRDYGHTAAEKSNELLLHMGIAVVGVSLLILFFLGWRESGVVLLAIPTTLALTLLVFYLYGYTLNRITLFALIFSIGILVDDAIVVVENIVRHLRLPGASSRPLREVAIEAVDEVGNSTLLATWAVIAAILPMAFVGGLMGPYMRPIPIGSTAAMLFSVIVAFTVTPWAALRVLRRHTPSAVADQPGAKGDHGHAPDDWSTRLYYKVMTPLVDKAKARTLFLLIIGVMLTLAAALVPLQAVKIKMLPFDNKSEFQLILNTPEGTTLEDTLALATSMADVVSREPEVADVQIYAGTAAPFNFNGLVRHYFMRRGANVADIQVNLVPKHERSAQSHDIATRIRPAVAALAAPTGASVAVAEVPPGPPVLQTLVAEIYAPKEEDRLRLATEVRRIFGETEGVVDIDWYLEEDQKRTRFVPDLAKLATYGINAAEVNEALALAWKGQTVGFLSTPHTQEAVPLRLVGSRLDRSDTTRLLGLSLRSRMSSGDLGPPIALAEVTQLVEDVAPRSLYRKNLQAVTYVTADVAGEAASPAYALALLHPKVAALDAREFGGAKADLPIYHLNQPYAENGPALKWDGEWHVTLEVFRDLGIAFAVVLLLIAMLMVGWFKNYSTPLVVMTAIPFSLVGILPAHWAMGAYFTATSMIGFMAGAGIVVRNSIILVDFIEQRRREGAVLRDAVIEAGAVRFRPMLLTALAVVVGASVILGDPIFQGLALSLMFGEIASLLISRLAVPVLYAWVEGRRSLPPPTT